MSSDKRRECIVRMLKDTDQAITGSQLSTSLGVSRQVIVADIALLRAQGETITATPRGYQYSDPSDTARHRKTIAAKHSSNPDEIREELYIIVDYGGTVLDVTVEHPLYGEMTGSLQIASRYDVENFLEKFVQSNAEPLLVLTDGLHLHTIVADSEETLQRIQEELDQKGYLAKS